MSFDEREIRIHLQQLVSADPSLSAWVQIRPKITRPSTLSFGKSETDAPMVRFPIYSIAKTILAILTLRLSDEGKLDLDAPISKYLKRPMPSWVEELSPLLLLSHRSGLFDYGPIPEYHERVRRSPSAADSPEQFVSLVFAKGPQFPAGSSFFYSNVGYLLVKELIETVAEKRLPELFDEWIGSQLQVDLKFLSGPSELIVSGFSPYLGPSAPDVRLLYDFKWVFHGTFISSLDGLTKLFSKLPELVSEDSFKQMIKLHRLGFSHTDIHPSYGLGLMGDFQADFGPVYGHNGGGPGFSVAAYTAPEKELVVAAVINRDSSVEAEKLVFEVLKRL